MSPPFVTEIDSMIHIIPLHSCKRYIFSTADQKQAISNKFCHYIHKERNQINSPNIYRYSTRASNQSTNEIDAEYGKIILKKFMLHVHPDYFNQFKYEKSINETNLKILSSSSSSSSDNNLNMTNSNNSESGYISESTRSLTFYLKSLQNNEKPRRVRVILSQRIESMREILETLGTDLPIRPDGMRQHYMNTNDPEDLEAFMDHLIERRDLLLWRSDQRLHFIRLQEILRNTLGVKAIEFRYSWSAQNNTVLIHAILSLIEHHYQELSLPWTGMTLVLSSDDSTHDPVDATEAHVKINPADVPMQWLRIFQSVRIDTLMKVHAVEQSLSDQVQYTEKIFSKVIKYYLLNRLKWSPENASQLNVVLKRGFTCSRGNMIQFLSNTNAAVGDHIILRNDNDTYNDTDININIINNEEIDNNHTSMRGFDMRWVDALPLQIKITIEEGHGTRLLESGDFRVDCRASWTNIEQLIQNRIIESIEKVVDRKLLLQRLDKAKQRLCSRLKIVSIDAGVGVDDMKFEKCLSGMDAYLNQSDNRNKGNKLRGLAGVKVKIGKYLGMSDDGACILPWNLFEISDENETSEHSYRV